MPSTRKTLRMRQVACLASLIGLTACASISVRTQSYLTAPHYPPSNPAGIQILAAEPKQPKQRLGEIILSVEGEPNRDRLEARLKEAAARLGADAVFIVQDRTHLFPLVYGPWWGPTITQEGVRNIVAVAIKYV